MKRTISGIVFDIDGVIADTRKSYLEAIAVTTGIYLEKILGIPKDTSSLLSLKDVETFKMLGGFNNDWDCVEGLLLYFLSLIPPPLDRNLSRATFNWLLRKKNIRKLLAKKDHQFLSYKEARFLILREKIVQIFQEVYLGPAVYQRCYKKPAVYWQKAGLHLKESPLLPKDFFQKLRKAGLQLGIATGRTRFEAAMVLKRFGLEKFFRSIVTADEVEKAEKRILQKTGKRPFLSKPHPFVLIQIAKQLGVERLTYVGDLPDDVKTARKAGHWGIAAAPIGFLKGISEKPTMRKELLRAGAAIVAESEKELEDYLIGRLKPSR
jgi:HAD superfamily hydrolase (TIGR01548 family)